MDSSLQLDTCFARLSYDGPREPTLPVLHALTAAHAQSIPFENLDVLLNRRIRLESDALFKKLVHDRRGGYCFEQNGLFLEVLGRLGFAVTPLSARVRLQRPRDFIPPRTHMFIRADIDGERWLSGVGVGALSLTCAIRLGTEDEQATPHEPRRIVRERSLLFHQARLGDAWHDVCEFTLEEMPAIDREVGNWFTSTHPLSHFRNRLIASRAASDGRHLTLLNDEFTVRQRDGTAVTRRVSSPEDLFAILAAEFGLHFAPGTRFELAELPA